MVNESNFNYLQLRSYPDTPELQIIAAPLDFIGFSELKTVRTIGHKSAKYFRRSIMPCYEDVTDTEKIEKQIEKNLKDEETANDVLQLIKNLCWETDITPDPMSQWLALLTKHTPKAQKWKTSDDLIEIYPSGTKGIGKSDRLLFQVGKTQVAIIKAYESEH